MKGKENFFQLASSLPIVSDTLSYAQTSYNIFKGKNHLLGAFMSGVEAGFFRATSTAYHVSRIAVPYDSIDHFASESLLKVEEKYPIIKKPTNQIWKECSTYTLSKISGVTSKKKIPDNLYSAVKTRVSTVVKSTANVIAETKPMKIINKATHKVIDKVEEVVEKLVPGKKSLKPKPRTKLDSLHERISDIISRTKVKLTEVARELEELKGEPKKKETKELSLQELVEVSEHLLSKFYEELHSLPKPEKIWDRAVHTLKRLTTASIITTLDGLKVTLPWMEKVYRHIKVNLLNSIEWAIKNGREITNEAYKEGKDKLVRLIRLVKRIDLKKLPPSLSHALEVFWGDLTSDHTLTLCLEPEASTSASETKEDKREMGDFTNREQSPNYFAINSESDTENESRNKSYEKSIQSSNQFGNSPSQTSLKSLEKTPSKSILSSTESSDDKDKGFWKRFKL